MYIRVYIHVHICIEIWPFILIFVSLYIYKFSFLLFMVNAAGQQWMDELINRRINYD